MLDVITDFWKPVKKAIHDNKLRAEELQIGSAIGFGFVPQALLSGRRLMVSAVNTYQFGDDRLTSFVLSQPGEPPVSLIVAESDGEQYLAISRRIAFSERMKLFDSRELDDILENPESTALKCQDGGADFKGWVVSSYRREIRALKGRIYKGDYRSKELPAGGDGVQDFEYALLVSDNNEHAIEIEKYGDGRLEIYATIYRRITDIGQITPPARAAAPVPVAQEPAPVAAAASKQPERPSVPAAAVPSTPVAEELKAQEAFVLAAVQDIIATAPAPAVLPEMNGAGMHPTHQEKPSMFNPLHDIKSEPKLESAAKTETPARPQPALVVQDSSWQKASPGKAAEQEKPEVLRIAERGEPMQEETLECDLDVAVKILDEARRNEMKISDVVRRIVELPLASQQKVQIPLNLSDSDYILLAHRYGMEPSSRDEIRTRVIKDLADFTGNKHFKAA